MAGYAGRRPASVPVPRRKGRLLSAARYRILSPAGDEREAGGADVAVDGGAVVLAPPAGAVLRVPLGQVAAVTEPAPFTVRIALAGLLALRRRWWHLAAFASAIVLSEALIGSLKGIYDRARPPGSMVATTNASFPSGHAIAASVTVVAAVIALVALRLNRLRDKRRVLVRGGASGARATCTEEDQRRDGKKQS